MKEYLNENTLTNTVAMFLAESDELVLVVEGPHDHLLLKEFCTEELQLMHATGGRPQVLFAAKIAYERGLSRARFLVDQDYDLYSGSTEAQLNNVLVSDHHDCFLDLIHADPSLLQRVIDVHCDSTRRRENLEASIPAPEAIQNEAFALASTVAATRVVDAKRSLYLDFKRFKFGSLSVADFDVVKIAEMILTRSQYEGVDRQEIVLDVASVYADIGQMKHKPVGDHDLFAAVARVMKRYGVHVSDENLRRGYILKVTGLALSATGWYQKIQTWCESFGKTGFNFSPQALAA